MEKKTKNNFSTFCKNFGTKAKESRSLATRKKFVESYSKNIKNELKECTVSDRQHLFQSFSL